MSITLEELWPAVEAAAPDNPVPLLVVADWCDENKRSRLGYALRWCAGHKQRPSQRAVKRWPWIWIRDQKRYAGISKAELDQRAHAVLDRPIFDAQEFDSWRANFKKQYDAYHWLAEALWILRSVVEVPNIVLPPQPAIIASGPVTCLACGIMRSRDMIDCRVCGSGEVKK